MSKDQFGSRWGIVLASLGMAIGAGNLWRFPRLAGQYGGSFILLWILFLFIWSIPLLLSEFAIGKQFKSGVIGSYARLTGKQFTWLGFFITICTLGIAFYYSVVTAWALRYFGFSANSFYEYLTNGISLNQRLTQNPDYLEVYWASLSNQSWVTVTIFVCVVIAGALLLRRGIKNGLERANRILIPSLFMLVIFMVILTLNMEKGILGLEYMFSINPEHFLTPRIWIEALSQSAWSTGAGWGLLMTLSSYTRSGEDVTLNTFIGAFGNNTASLLAGMAILPAVFAMAASEVEAITYLQSGNQALTFTIIPKLFSQVPGGDFLALLFFLALFVAAFSSFLPMIELLQRNLIDLGLKRKKSIYFIIAIFVMMGFPSAWSLDYFTNQDWVWGLGLILTGLIVLFGVALNNPARFKKQYIDRDSDMKVSTTYFSIFVYLNLCIGIFLIYWWLSQGYSDYPWFNANGNWNLFDIYSNASLITQWFIVLCTGFLINTFLYKKFAQ